MKIYKKIYKFKPGDKVSWKKDSWDLPWTVSHSYKVHYKVQKGYSGVRVSLYGPYGSRVSSYEEDLQLRIDACNGGR